MSQVMVDLWLLTPRPWPAAEGGVNTAPFPRAWPWQLPGCAAAVVWLQAHDCAGRIVAFGAEDCPATASIIQAATLTGTTVVLLNRRLDAATLAEQCRRAGSVRLITHAGHPLHGGGITAPEFFTDDPANALSGAVTNGGLILFTGGTTGVPKPALISATALLYAACAGAAALALSPRDRWLAVLPLDHIGGVMTVLRAAVAGCSVELHRRFQLEHADAGLDRCHGAALVPTQFHRLITARENGGRLWSPGLRTLLIGGAPLAPELAERSRRLGLAPQQAYGMTETAAMVSVQRAAHSANVGACGTVVPGMELAVCDDHDQPLPDGQAGRIAVRGGSLFSGYLADHAHMTAAPVAGQWWFTGDLGVITADGQLQLNGRRDDLIISGGENMYPVEIEAVLATHPSIRDVAVVGVTDAEWGQVVAAAVVLKPDLNPSTGWDRDAFTTWLAARLGHRRPRRLAVLAELPRTALGKIDRRAVRHCVEAATA